jgi:hypothetical protein
MNPRISSLSNLGLDHLSISILVGPLAIGWVCFFYQPLYEMLLQANFYIRKEKKNTRFKLAL